MANMNLLELNVSLAEIEMNSTRRYSDKLTLSLTKFVGSSDFDHVWAMWEKAEDAYQAALKAYGAAVDEKANEQKRRAGI